MGKPLQKNFVCWTTVWGFAIVSDAASKFPVRNAVSLLHPFHQLVCVSFKLFSTVSSSYLHHRPWRCPHTMRSRICVTDRYVCPIDRQQQRRPVGLLLSAGVYSRYRSIAAGTVLQAPALSSKWGSVILRADGGGSTQTCLPKFQVKLERASFFFSGWACWFNASIQFCVVTALLTRWQVIPANFVVFCNLSSFRHPSGSYATEG